MASLETALVSAQQENIDDISVNNIIYLTNESRKEKNLEPLVQNAKLTEAANKKAQDMLIKNYFAHNSPDNLSPWYWIDKEGYDYKYAGENLAMNFTSAKRMHNAWLESPTHRANIMNAKFKEIGVGVAEGFMGEKHSILVVQMFGSGDKNLAKKEKEIDNLNRLPDIELRENPILPIEPVITSPVNGQKISRSKVDIYGRAKPGEKITVKINDGEKKEIVTANPNGWFFDQINVEKGTLKIEAESVNSEKGASYGGENKIRRESKDSYQGMGKSILVNIDFDQPKVAFEVDPLSSFGKKNLALIRTFTNEEGITINFGKERRWLQTKKKAAYLVNDLKQNETIMITAVDEAGNKMFRQIELNNSKQIPYSKISDSVGSFILPEIAEASELGINEVRKKMEDNSNQVVAGILLTVVWLNLFQLIRPTSINPLAVANVVFFSVAAVGVIIVQ